MSRDKPQHDVCVAPSIHRQVLLLDMTSDDVTGFRIHISRFPAMVQGLKERFSEAQLSVVFAIGNHYWPIVGTDSEQSVPIAELEIPEQAEYPFPIQFADLAIVVKSDRPDACYFAAQVILQWLEPFAQLQRDFQGFRYLDGRNLFGFLDLPERESAVARYHKAFGFSPQHPEPTANGIVSGYTYMWVTAINPDLRRWDMLSSDQQREIMGIDKLSGSIWPTSQKGHHEVLAEHSQNILRDPMPNFSLKVPSETWLDFSAYPHQFQSLLNSYICHSDANEGDPLMDYLNCTFSSAFIVPSMQWFDFSEQR